MLCFCLFRLSNTLSELWVSSSHTITKSAKRAWDILQEIYEKSRYRELKNEGDIITLKRDRSQISRDEEHKDQNPINPHKAFTSIVVKEESPQQNMEVLEVVVIDA